MSVQDEITQIAFELYQNIQTGDDEIPPLAAALELVRETEEIDAIALAYLIGLKACRLWFELTRDEQEFELSREKFRNPGKGLTSDAHQQSVKRLEELKETTRDELEVLLTLGYMELYGSRNVSRPLINPIAECIADIFEPPSRDADGVDIEYNVYNNLWGRCDRYMGPKANRSQRKKNEDEALTEGSAFLKKIITKIYVPRSLDIEVE